MAEPFDTAKDVVSRQRLAIIESNSVPGQPGLVVLNPNGSNISGGGGGGGDVNIHDAAGNNINNGQQTMANSVPVVVASNQTSIPTTNTNAAGASAVNIQDGGNSITVDGTVAATQRGVWSVAVNNAAGAAAVNVQDGGNSLTVDGTVAATQSGTWSTRIQDSSGSSITNGQQTMANSVPVVIASNQTAIPVSISGSATSLTPSSGQVNVAAGPTASPLAGVSTQVDEVIIVAKLTNTGNIFLGPSTVISTTGMIMEPGRSVALESVDLNTVYINGTAGEGVTFFSLT